MTEYTVRYGHGNGSPGQTTIQERSWRGAIRAVRRLVADGYRGDTWATVELPGGAYTARNVGGRAVGRVVQYGGEL